MSKLIRCLVLGAAVTSAAFGTTSAARTEGAIAVGTSGNFAKDGFAFGGSIDKESVDAAREQALETCRKFEGAPKMAAMCRVIATFSRECYALSMDPKTGTPGVGWSIASDKETAEDRALANCRVTAGPNRRDECKLNQSYCDTHD
jgi:Domain of unknown function (DUF4189)